MSLLKAAQMTQPPEDNTYSTQWGQGTMPLGVSINERQFDNRQSLGTEPQPASDYRMDINHLLWFHGTTNIPGETDNHQMQSGSFHVDSMNPIRTQSANIVGETDNHQMHPGSFQVDITNPMGTQSANIVEKMNNYQMQPDSFSLNVSCQPDPGETESPNYHLNANEFNWFS